MAAAPRRLLRWVRGLATFVLSVFISLGIGAAFERLTDAETITKLLEVQRATLETVSAFSPGELGERYIEALGFHASTDGDFGFDPTVFLPRTPAAAPASPDPDAAVSPPLHSPAEIAAAAPEPRLRYWADDAPAVFRPLVALEDVVWNLFPSWSAGRFLVVIAELSLGLLVSVVVLRRILIWPVLKFAALPICTVAVGVLAAFATKLLILWGLAAFSRATGLAGLCCSTTGFAFASYKFAVKAVEDRVQEHGHALINRWTPGGGQE